MSRTRINKLTPIVAREESVTEEKYNAAYEMCQQWRSQNLIALHSCFSQLSECFGDNAICTARLKRMESIIEKARKTRGGSNKTRIGDMDDIAGCRVIVDDMNKLCDAEKRVEKMFNHPTPHDYVRSPKRSGYRSFHYVVHVPEGGINYRVEIQLRTKLQHLWATGVETACEATGLDLKNSMESALGNQNHLVDDQRIEMLLFLQHASELFAAYEGGWDLDPVATKVRADMRKTTVQRLLMKMRIFAQSELLDVSDSQEDENDGPYVVELDRDEQNIRVRKCGSYDNAIEIYNDAELSAIRSDRHVNVVLINSVGRPQLRAAYPNYLPTDGGSLESKLLSIIKSSNV